MASITWKSGVSGSWTTGSNWTTGVPGVGDDVWITASGSYIISAVVPTFARSLTVNAAGATLTNTSTLSLGGLLALTAGTYSLNGGAIVGGTIAVGGGGFVVNSGTLNGVTYRGALTLSNAGANLNIVGSLVATGSSGTGAGSVNLSGTSAILAFVGTQTFDNAVVDFGSAAPSGAARLVERDIPTAGATLTLGPSLSVRSNGGTGYITAVDTPGNDVLVNAGTIGFGASGGLIEISANSFVNQGQMKVTGGGTLDLLTGPLGVPAGEIGSNTGSITISSGLLAFGSSFINTGSVVASGGTVAIAGTFATTGTFVANNTKVTIGGTVSGAALLALLNNATDTVAYTAVYENAGAVLNIGSGSAVGTLSLTTGLPIRNGTIADAGGGFVFNGGTLTNVAYQGTVDLSRDGASLYIATQLRTAGAGGVGAGAVLLTGTATSLSLIGSQTLDHATVTIGSSLRAQPARLIERDVAGTGATLTLGPTLKVSANAGYGLLQSTGIGANDALVNLGVVEATSAGGLLEISANQFTNQGTLRVGGGATLDVLTGPYTPPPGETGVNSGTIAATGGLLALGGTLTNTGSIGVNGGTLSLAGTFVDAGAMRIDNAIVNLGGVFKGVSLLKTLTNASDTVTVTGTYDNSGDTLTLGAGSALGTLTLRPDLPISGGTIVDTGGGLVCAGGTLDGVTYVGALTLGADQSLDVIDGLVVQNGTAGGPGSINLAGGWSALNLLNAQTLDHLVITLGDASGNPDGLYDNALGTVTLGPDTLVQQSAGSGRIYSYATATTVNQGRIAITGGEFEIAGNGGLFVNAGSIGVSGGATLAANTFFGSQHFSNTGTLTATGGASVTLEAGWSNTGAIRVSGATLHLGSDTTTAWSGVGTIAATNATLELAGAFTRAQLNQLQIAGGSTTIMGQLDNTGGTLQAGGGTALGAIALQGGTIRGGTIADVGGGLVVGDGTLDGVVYQGALSVGAGSSLWIQNGLSLRPGSGIGNGTLTLAGGSSGLFVLDSETLDNATITLGDNSGETDFIENYVVAGGGTLTLGANLRLQQSVGDAAIYTAAGGTTINRGCIAVSGGGFHVDYGTFSNAGSIDVSGSGSLTVNVAGFTNTGRLAATAGGDIALQAGWTNTGTIAVDSGGSLRLGSDTTTGWGAIGTITATNATLDLYGAFTTAQLLSLGLTNDTLDVGGMLDNTGRTLSIGAGSAMRSFGPVVGGIVRGGILADAGGGLRALGGTLDAVSFRGTLAVDRAGQLGVTGGLTLRSSTGAASGALSLTGGGSTLSVLDTETLDGATVTIGDASSTLDVLANGGANGTTLTLGANLLVQQTLGQAQLLNTGGLDQIVNRGQIAVSGGTLDIMGGTFVNAGTLSVSGSGSVVFEPGSLGNFAAGALSGGVYAVGAGTTLELAANTFISTLNADVTLAGAGSAMQSLNASNAEIGLETTLRTIGVAGALRLLSGRSLSTLGTITDQGLLQLAGGTISTPSGVVVTGTLLGFGSLQSVLADNGMVEANGGLLTIGASNSGSGRLQIDAGATLELVTTSALASAFSGSGGTLQIDRPTTYTGTIGGFAIGDTIVLGGVTAANASIVSNVLSVNLTDGTTLTYNVGGSFAGLAVRTASVGSDTAVTVVAAAPTHITGLLDNRGRTLSVSNTSTLQLDGGTVLGGTIADTGGGFVIGFGTLDGITYRGALTVGAGGLLNVQNGLTTRSLSGAASGTIVLAGGGSTMTVLDSETLDQATILIGDASGTADVLSNGGANGTTLTLGAGITLRQSTGQAQLLGTGSTDLTINRGLISVTGGTLDIGGNGGFSNVGTISVGGGGTVMFEPATLRNIASSTLSGGVWSAGAGSTIQLARNSFVATLNADVTLSGAGSSLQCLNASNVQTTLDSTLRTIGASGALRLLGGRSLAMKVSVLDQGTLQLAGGTISNNGTTTIANLLIGYGTVAGVVSDTGLIEANGGVLAIMGASSGSGRMQIDAGATLELGTTCALNAAFAGAAGTLLLDKPTTYSGTIGGFAVGETIVLAGATANAASITGSTLGVSLTNGRTLAYALTGSFAGLAVQATNVGGNAAITLTSSGGAAAALATPITASQLSLASAGFLNPLGQLAGRVVAAQSPGATLVGDPQATDVFTGTLAALDHGLLQGFGAADLIDVTDLAFATASASIAWRPEGATLSLGDASHAGSLTLTGLPAMSLALWQDGRGGTVIAHR